MKKLILIAATLMLLSVSLMGITFSINVIRATTSTHVYISGWTGVPGGPWTDWNHVEMTRGVPNSGGNGYIYYITAPSNGHNGFDVTAYAGGKSSRKTGSEYISGNNVWLDSIVFPPPPPPPPPPPVNDRPDFR